MEANAWDGAWYRRAYFDDGTPLGSAENNECQIDAIAQAWAVISGVAHQARTQSAMDAVQHVWCVSDDKLIQLFDPPFDKGRCSPATSKAMCPAFARTAVNTHTRRLGWCGYGVARPRRSALKLWNLINPIYHATRRRKCSATRSSPTWSAPTCTARRRIPGAAAGRGTPAQRLAVPRRAGSDSRLPSRRQHASPAAVRAAKLAAIRDDLPPSFRDLSDIGGQLSRHGPRRPVGRVGRASRSPTARYPSATTRRCTRFGWHWVDGESSTMADTASNG